MVNRVTAPQGLIPGRSKYGITVVGVKRPQTDFTYATPETVIERGDLLIVSGPTKLVEKFAAIA
ncbi:TrkA C-terminal domain-containing protein [Mesorhizobium amorphae]|uniref:TrkA C-terminal domain-containing protein n=1 Tax=Mesorhizobium amorphae TaxID=71433 RepID=UPI001FEE71C8|nr:TrkA C-terminal domain-containing protein [Mesorhizobium amorphae]